MAARTFPPSVARSTFVNIGRVAVLPCALLMALVLATMIGSVAIAPSDTIHILMNKLGLYAGPVTWSSGEADIIWEVRLPRVLAAALVGASLGVAGTLFQAVLRNPLADPYVIGTSAGAQVGVAAALLFSLQFSIAGFGPIQILAFAGAVLTVLFVYSIARTGGRTPVVTLLLAGFATSSFLISASSFLMMAGNRIQQVLMWTFGSMDVSGSQQLRVAAPLILLALLIAYLLAPKLDVVLLGEEQAAHLGVRVESLKLGAVILAALLTSLAVTLAGIVAFVGLIVPHAARLVYGPNHRILIPAAACGGALFLVMADAIAHVILPPTIVPLGAVTAIVGAPFFLHLLRRSKRSYAL